jgi:ferric-dicitrate binding protein FerR (iron transport regulator)
MAPLREMRPDLSPEICAWVGRLMATYPERRPDSAVAALAELETVLAAPQAEVPVPRVKVPTEPLATGRRRWAGIGLAAAVLILCGVYLQVHRKGPPAGQPAQTEVAASHPTP